MCPGKACVVKVQNLLASVVFSVLLAACVLMQLLQWYPSNSTLWYLNITYAREARPVLELFQFLPFDGLYQNIGLVTAMLLLCGIAIRRKSLLLTSATTHIAAYAAIFAVIASSYRTFGNLKAASASATDFVAFASAMEPGQMALMATLFVGLLSCVCNHCQIITDMLREKFSRAS